jgi:hypothetical protein
MSGPVIPAALLSAFPKKPLPSAARRQPLSVPARPTALTIVGATRPQRQEPAHLRFRSELAEFGCAPPEAVPLAPASFAFARFALARSEGARSEGARCELAQFGFGCVASVSRAECMARQRFLALQAQTGCLSDLATQRAAAPPTAVRVEQWSLPTPGKPHPLAQRPSMGPGKAKQQAPISLAADGYWRLEALDLAMPVDRIEFAPIEALVDN